MLGSWFQYTYGNTANQLVREDNMWLGKAFVWTYDDAGNILFRKEYAYTYGDSDWGDLLTGYNGKTITYDTIGNPLSDGTWTYTWEHGRELASISNGSVAPIRGTSLRYCGYVYRREYWNGTLKDRTEDAMRQQCKNNQINY